MTISELTILLFGIKESFLPIMIVQLEQLQNE